MRASWCWALATHKPQDLKLRYIHIKVVALGKNKLRKRNVFSKSVQISRMLSYKPMRRIRFLKTYVLEATQISKFLIPEVVVVCCGNCLLSTLRIKKCDIPCLSCPWAG